MNITYSDKLRDVRWAERKTEHLKHSCRCVLCGSTDRLNVHHRAYRRGAEPWEYDEADLLTLCENCHATIHEAEMKAKAFVISLQPDQAVEFGELIRALALADRSGMSVAIARARSAVTAIRHGTEPRHIADILAGMTR